MTAFGEYADDDSASTMKARDYKDATDLAVQCVTAEGFAALMDGGGDKPHVLAPPVVRRLTPTECERLQGFPDGWTDVPYRNKPAADAPRYKALGNSMAVPCMAFIGRRIAAYNNGELE